MATTKGETKLSRCSACSDDGNITVARHYCVDCEMYFCTKCVKSHKTIPVLRKHQVNDVNSSESTDVEDDTMERVSEYVHSLRCTLHQGKLIDTYCKDHDEVCCGACAVVKHRSCTTVSIGIAAKDFKSSPDINECNEALTADLVQLKQERKKRSDNLDCIGKQKLELIEKVDRYEEKIIAKIKELANISRKEIRSKYDEHKRALDTDIEALDVVKTTTAGYIDRLAQTDNDKLFVSVKTSKAVRKDGEMLLQAMKTDWRRKEINFRFDKSLENQSFGVKFGRLEDCVDMSNKDDPVVTEYSVTFQRTIDLKQRKDSNASVLDLCFVDSSDLILTDYHNRKLKRFSSDLQFKDEILLSGEPVAVCNIGENEVAVRIWNTRVVHFVIIGQIMQLKSSFTLAGNGNGMTYDAGTGEIFACEENRVSVYSKTGHILKTYNTDANGEQMFSSCRQIALNVNTQAIYVTDENKGMIVFDKSGRLKMKNALSSDFSLWPICLLPGHICLAGSRTSGLIVQIDQDGKQIGTLIGSCDGRQYTLCAVYDRDHSRLIVGGYPNVISVYEISAKGK